MQFIIIGLGSYGGSLAESLTQQGHEVIGIDKKMEKVEYYKDKISHTICMDSTDQFTMGGLPLKDTDIVVVAIGEDPGASIMATAVLKNLQVKRIIGRAISPLHENVLEAMGITEIVRPEQESATRWAKKLTSKGLEDSFELNPHYSIGEIRLPLQFEGKTVAEIGFRREYNLVVLTTIRQKEVKSKFGQPKLKNLIDGVASYETILHANDLVVVYGNNKDIQRAAV